MQDCAAEVEEIEKLRPEVSTRLRAALQQALRTSLCRTAKFYVSDAHNYPLHGIHPPCAPILAALPPLSISSTPRSSRSPHFCAHRRREACLSKLKDARPDVQISAVFPKHAAVIAHELHCAIGEEDERRRRAEGRETQQAANAEKTTTVTELITLPLVEDLGLKLLPLPHSLSADEYFKITKALYPLADIRSALFTYVGKHDLVNCFEQQFINISSNMIFSAALYVSLNAKGTTCTHTHITGFEPFNIPADALADTLRVLCTSSTSVSLVAGGGPEVMVQGAQTRVVLELLESLGVPKKWIETAGIKDKKKN
ncbi:hypothetical protein EDB89DRAFT_1295299 [Lactarius sanguifluus]|nr:hypothetical protein EDB89DRAFT_1295299 [Lactarius sanguifluus]